MLAEAVEQWHDKTLRHSRDAFCHWAAFSAVSKAMAVQGTLKHLHHIQSELSFSTAEKAAQKPSLRVLRRPIKPL